MKRPYLWLAAAALCLTGCQGPAEEPVSPTEPAAPTAAAAESSVSVQETEPPAAAAGMPVLSIVTENQSDTAMDFVTEPVAEHVAASIASWTPGYVMPPAPYYETCAVTLTDADGTAVLDAAAADVKVRGNWTTNYEKKPLRLKFAEKQTLLGLDDGKEQKNWLLLAEYKDYSMLRNRAMLSIGSAILGADGLFAADTALVEVEINGNYWGVYLLTEMQTKPGCLGITNPEKDYTGTDIGYILEYDGYYADEDALHSFAVDYADNAPLIAFAGDTPGETIRPLNEGGDDLKQDVGFTIKSDIYSQEQHDFIAAYVSSVYRILYAAAYENTAYAFNEDYTAIVPAPDMTPQEAAAAAVNLDSLADMYLISELACDADIYWSSFFLTADFGEGGDRRLTFQAPWDYDSALGNKDRCADGKGFYAASVVPDVNNLYETINPWLAVLMQEQWFRAIVREKWQAARDAGVITQACAQIREETVLYHAAFTRSEERWPEPHKNRDVRNELCRRSLKCKNQQEAADYLAEWLETRAAFLDSYWG